MVTGRAEKAAAAQYDAGPAATVLNVYRHLPGEDAPVAAFTPRSLAEHEHTTLQVSVLLRESIAGIGWHTGGAKAASRRVRGGQAYVVPSNQPHDFHLYRPEGMVNFHIGPEALTALAPELFSAGGAFAEMQILSDPIVSALAAGVHAAAANPDRLTAMYIDAAWTMLALQLARFAMASEEIERATGYGLTPRRLASVLEHIEDHYADPSLRISDLAAAAGLSPVHFSRVFARQAGVSPMQFVIERRLKLARELLASDGSSISSIAQDAGFGSHARLSEAFRRRFGQTPSAFRFGRQQRSPKRGAGDTLTIDELSGELNDRPGN